MASRTLRGGRSAGGSDTRAVIVAVAFATLVSADAALAEVPQSDCDGRNNNTYPKLLECIRLD